jgi:hypothetical protein
VQLNGTLIKFNLVAEEARETDGRQKDDWMAVTASVVPTDWG